MSSQPSYLKHASGSKTLDLGEDEACVIAFYSKPKKHLEAFITHHLQLGFKHIIFVAYSFDERLKNLAKSHPQITIYRSTKKLDHLKKNRVVEFLRDQHCRNRFSVVLHVNEFFNYLYSSLVSLKEFIGFLNENRYSQIVSYIINLNPISSESPEDCLEAVNKPVFIKQEIDSYKTESGISRMYLKNSFFSFVKTNLTAKFFCKNDGAPGLSPYKFNFFGLPDYNLSGKNIASSLSLICRINNRKTSNLSAKQRFKLTSTDEVFSFVFFKDIDRNLVYESFIREYIFENFNFATYAEQFLDQSLEHNSNYQKFLIIAKPRTGSNLLCSLLNSHPEVSCSAEIFNQERSYFHKQSMPIFDKVLMVFRSLNPIRFLDVTLFHAKYPERVKAVGFKLLEAQLKSFSIIDTYISRKKNIKVIFLSRKNYLKRLYSQKQATMYNQWTLESEKKRINSRIRFSKESCLQSFASDNRFYNRYRQFFKNKGIEFLEICYEDMNDNPEEELRKVKEFLNLSEDIAFQTNMKKQNVKPLEESISNFESLKKEFSGTKWESFFEAV